MPSINGLAEELGGQGLTVLLVNLGEDRQTVARVAKERRYTAPVLLDLDREAADDYSVRATPTVFLVGRDGFVLGGAVGPRLWARPEGRALLHSLLAAR